MTLINHTPHRHLAARVAPIGSLLTDANVSYSVLIHSIRSATLSFKLKDAPASALNPRRCAARDLTHVMAELFAREQRPSFIRRFESAKIPEWTAHYIEVRKLIRKIREFKEEEPNPSAERLQRYASKFARKLHVEIEVVNLFATECSGLIAAAIARNVQRSTDLAGKLNNNKLKRLALSGNPTEKLAIVRDIHASFCDCARDVSKLIVYLDWNMRAIDKLIRRSTYTFGANSHTFLDLEKAEEMAASGAIDTSCLIVAHTAPRDLELPVLPRYKWMSRLILHSAAQIHLSTIAKNHHIKTVATFIATIARLLNRLAVAEEYLIVSSPLLRMTETAYCRLRGDRTVFDLVDKMRRMQDRKVTFQRTLAAQSGIFFANIVDEDIKESIGSPGAGASMADQDRREGLPAFNMWLNVISAFLYMVSMYAALPTAGTYARTLGSSPAMSGLLIGGAPFAGMFSAVIYSWLSNQGGFKRSLILASSICMSGNLVYALAATYGSIIVALMGRFIIGFGGARAVNRRYISDCAPKSELLMRSAHFVTASALGMSAGPALAALVNRFAPVRVGDLYFDNRTNTSWTLFAVWALYIMVLIRCFAEPPQRASSDPLFGRRAESPLPMVSSTSLVESNGYREYGSITPGIERFLGFRIAERKSRPLRDLLNNTPILFCLFLYFIIKMVCDLLLTSAPLSMPHLFRWDQAQVAPFVASLGALMIPANTGVTELSKIYDKRQQLYYSIVAVLVGCVLALPLIAPMSLLQYVLACVIIFVSTNWAEACVYPILKTLMPKSLDVGTFNGGLLATEAGMLGRAVGDIGVSLAAIGDNAVQNLLWRQFIPSSVVVGMCIFGLHRFWDSLTPEEPIDEGSADNDGEDTDIDSEDDYALYPSVTPKLSYEACTKPL